MITELSISRTASFVEMPQVLSNFSNNNYFYGANGSGKTTISRVVVNHVAATPLLNELGDDIFVIQYCLFQGTT